jgi:decaprenyl-phosphate phosphoribosyltransferase
MHPVHGASGALGPAAEAVVPPPVAMSSTPPDTVPLEAPARLGSAAAGLDDDPASARSLPVALLALARPRQWIKNLLVIAAPAAAGALLHHGTLPRVLAATIAFCLLSAGIYSLNDVGDRAEDRLHPRKCRRPVACGDVSPPIAVAFGAGALLLGLVICLLVTPLLALIGLGYVALTVSYSWVWRNIAWVDLVALATGFVLRAAAGGAAAPVHLSRWFVLVITFCALFVAVGKRLSEMLRAAAAGRRPRRVVRRYSEAGLQRALVVSGLLALFAYCMWAFQVPVIDGIPWRLTTILPFAECLRRYGQLIRAGAAEAPEDAITSDRIMAAVGLAWCVLFALSVNAA